MIRIIAFTGKKGNGKSTASNKVREVLEGQGLTVVRINFKDGLVSTMREKLSGTLEELSRLYNISINELFEEKPPMMRKLMQEVGTEIYRSIDNDYWVKQWEKSIKEKITRDSSLGVNSTVVIVDDVRFQNEFDAVKSLGGTVTRIVATNKDRVVDEHQSEKEQDSFECDFSFVADSKENLEAIVTERLTQL